jgi:hypothetical protein
MGTRHGVFLASRSVWSGGGSETALHMRLWTESSRGAPTRRFRGHDRFMKTLKGGL